MKAFDDALSALKAADDDSAVEYLCVTLSQIPVVTQGGSFDSNEFSEDSHIKTYCHILLALIYLRETLLSDETYVNLKLHLNQFPLIWLDEDFLWNELGFTTQEVAILFALHPDGHAENASILYEVCGRIPPDKVRDYLENSNPQLITTYEELFDLYSLSVDIEPFLRNPLVRSHMTTAKHLIQMAQLNPDTAVSDLLFYEDCRQFISEISILNEWLSVVTPTERVHTITFDDLRLLITNMDDFLLLSNHFPEITQILLNDSRLNALTSEHLETLRKDYNFISFFKPINKPSAVLLMKSWYQSISFSETGELPVKTCQMFIKLISSCPSLALTVLQNEDSIYNEIDLEKLLEILLLVPDLADYFIDFSNDIHTNRFIHQLINPSDNHLCSKERASLLLKMIYKLSVEQAMALLQSQLIRDFLLSEKLVIAELLDKLPDAVDVFFPFNRTIGQSSIPLDLSQQQEVIRVLKKHARSGNINAVRFLALHYQLGFSQWSTSDEVMARITGCYSNLATQHYGVLLLLCQQDKLEMVFTALLKTAQIYLGHGVCSKKSAGSQGTSAYLQGLNILNQIGYYACAYALRNVADDITMKRLVITCCSLQEQVQYCPHHTPLTSVFEFIGSLPHDNMKLLCIQTLMEWPLGNFQEAMNMLAQNYLKLTAKSLAELYQCRYYMLMGFAFAHNNPEAQRIGHYTILNWLDLDRAILDFNSQRIIMAFMTEPSSYLYPSPEEFIDALQSKLSPHEKFKSRPVSKMWSTPNAQETVVLSPKALHLCPLILEEGSPTSSL